VDQKLDNYCPAALGLSNSMFSFLSSGRRLGVVPARNKKRRIRFIKGQWMEITDRRTEYQERLKQYMSQQ
jgi:hypothetical protein